MQGKAFFIYDKLYSKFGTQKWWPTTLEGELEPSYHGNPPDDKARFEIAVGAVLTQNTAWTNVVKAISNLNKKGFLYPNILITENKESITSAIKSSGYFNQKYKKLISLSNWWKDNFIKVKIGSKNKKSINTLREELLSINGIGPETADSILLYSFDMPSFVIDTYTKRILSRHFCVDPKIKYEELRSMFMEELPNDVTLFKEYHALLVELGKTLCRKSVCLEDCPLK